MRVQFEDLADSCLLSAWLLLTFSLFFLNGNGRGGNTEISHAIIGLNLLYLLVENRLADFHCEVFNTVVYS